MAKLAPTGNQCASTEAVCRANPTSRNAWKTQSSPATPLANGEAGSIARGRSATADFALVPACRTTPSARTAECRRVPRRRLGRRDAVWVRRGLYFRRLHRMLRSGASRCSGNDVQTCEPTARWSVDASCPTGSVCAAGFCETVRRTWLCAGRCRVERLRRKSRELLREYGGSGRLLLPDLRLLRRLSPGKCQRRGYPKRLPPRQIRRDRRTLP